MSYTVVLTDTAKQDLREIVIWIAEQSKDIQVAKKFVNELRIECHKLDMFPSRGAWPRDHILKSMGYRFIAYKDYLIFYLIDEKKNEVNIMVIFNVKKDCMRIMKKFI